MREREGNEGKGEEERLEVREADQKTPGEGMKAGPTKCNDPFC